MSTKKIILEFEFEEHMDDYGGWTEVKLVKIERTRSDFTPAQLDRLTDEVAQTDKWQVHRWIDIQTALTDPDHPSVRYTE